jgi:hypothetical protein
MLKSRWYPKRVPDGEASSTSPFCVYIKKSYCWKPTVEEEEVVDVDEEGELLEELEELEELDEPDGLELEELVVTDVLVELVVRRTEVELEGLRLEDEDPVEELEVELLLWDVVVEAVFVRPGRTTKMLTTRTASTATAATPYLKFNSKNQPPRH